MTRKRTKKLLMSLGFTRDTAENALARNNVNHDRLLADSKRLIHTLRNLPEFKLMPDEAIIKICFGGKVRTFILRK